MISKTIGYNGVFPIFRQTHITFGGSKREAVVAGETQPDFDGEAKGFVMTPVDDKVPQV